MKDMRKIKSLKKNIKKLTRRKTTKPKPQNQQ